MSTDRLSDEVVHNYATEAYGPNHHPHLAMLAREVQERRAAEAVAPVQVDDTPNPYRFTVKVKPIKNHILTRWWAVDLFCGDTYLAHWGFDTVAEAREHAHLIARALREVTVDEG